MTPDQAYSHLLEVSGSLSQLVVLAMLLERALALLFEYKWFRVLSDKVPGLKTPIAFLAAWFSCHWVGFDVLVKLFPSQEPVAQPSAIGILITAAIVAGGSAGAITLFQGVLHFDRDSRKGLIEARRAAAEADLAEAVARKTKADMETTVAEVRKRDAEIELSKKGNS